MFVLSRDWFFFDLVFEILIIDLRGGGGSVCFYVLNLFFLLGRDVFEWFYLIIDYLEVFWWGWVVCGVYERYWWKIVVLVC